MVKLLSWQPYVESGYRRCAVSLRVDRCTRPLRPRPGVRFIELSCCEWDVCCGASFYWTNERNIFLDFSRRGSAPDSVCLFSSDEIWSVTPLTQCKWAKQCLTNSIFGSQMEGLTGNYKNKVQKERDLITNICFNLAPRRRRRHYFYWRRVEEHFFRYKLKTSNKCAVISICMQYN